jgi:hypothetical protein
MIKKEIYEIPSSIIQLFYEFEHGESSYKIINENISMDNNESMQHFIDCVGIPTENIENNQGTQIVLSHKDYNYKIVVDAGGLGDFYSNCFDMSRYEEFSNNFSSSSDEGVNKRLKLKH